MHKNAEKTKKLLTRLYRKHTIMTARIKEGCLNYVPRIIVTMLCGVRGRYSNV